MEKPKKEKKDLVPDKETKDIMDMKNILMERLDDVKKSMADLVKQSAIDPKVGEEFNLKNRRDTVHRGLCGLQETL